MHVVLVGPQDAEQSELTPGWYIAAADGRLLAGPFPSELAARQRLPPPQEQGRER